MSTDPETASALCLAAYDRWAETYDNIDNPMLAEASEALRENARLFAGARVLELGCGTGRNAALCLTAGATRFVGIDGSEEMLARAKTRVVDPRASWMHADLSDGLRRLQNPRTEFDAILICLVLEHFEALTDILTSARRVLAPQGHALILELHPQRHQAGVGANFRDGDREVRLVSIRHSAADFRSACAQAGFCDVSDKERVPCAAALAVSPKLARYVGQPVLLELLASA